MPLRARRILSAVFLFFFAGVVETVFAAVVDEDLAARLEAARPGERIEVILRLKESADLRPAASLSGRAERRRALVKTLKEANARAAVPVESFLRSAGAERPRRLLTINALAVSVDVQTIRRLIGLEGVERLSLDARLAPADPLNAATAAVPEWNLAATGAVKLWQMGHTGEGAQVAVMDSGADAAHPDLAPRWRGETGGWHDPYGQHPAPAEPSPVTVPLIAGHGTQVLGVIVGGSAGGTAIGMAPDARWMAVKIYDDAGTAALSAIHDGFGWLLDPDGDPETADLPDVVNNSWGFLNPSTPEERCWLEFQSDIDLLLLADVYVVFAAGNQGPGSNTDLSPANNPGAFAVGAVEPTGEVANFSSRGPSACGGVEFFPDMVAPGDFIRTSDLTFGGTVPNSYKDVYGTSFAAAHVSGAVALLRAAWPDAAAGEVEAALLASARDLADPGPDDVSGHGAVDVFEAYRKLAPAGCEDLDGDGYFVGSEACGAVDCDDADMTVNPTALEICDGKDNDCDLSTDEGLTFDADGDGFTAIGSCTGSADDCDDMDTAVHPGPEVYDVPGDGIDQDCDGVDPSPPASGGSGGGGCFLENLFR